jgi:hypothetical protein
VPGTVTFELADDPVGDHIILSGEGRAVEAQTLDAVLDGRRALGVKLDLEGAEELAVAGASASLAAHAIALLQLEWNSTSQDVVGHDRAPLSTTLRGHGYGLFRPGPGDVLQPLADDGYGADVFALAAAPERAMTYAAVADHLRRWRQAAGG